MGGATLLVLAVVAVVLVALSRGEDERTTEEMISAFRDEGLEVGKVQPQRPEPGSPLPNVWKKQVRFLIPSIGPDAGGRVFTFEEEEDLNTVRSYYEGLNDLGGLFCCSHVYTDGLVLVQVPGDVPKNRADEYGRVLEETS